MQIFSTKDGILNLSIYSHYINIESMLVQLNQRRVNKKRYINIDSKLFQSRLYRYFGLDYCEKCNFFSWIILMLKQDDHAQNLQ